MPREGVPIQSLLWRTFTPAIVVVAVALSVLVYNRLYSTILDGFARKLVTTSSLTAALIDPADHDGLMASLTPGKETPELETSRPYLHNVLPMRKVKAELGLTYLYTQVLGGSKDLYYVLDSSQGDDHSPIGSEDVMTAETKAGLKTATRDGTVYISPIEFQEQWGLLKTAAAPVRARDGHISATAGADVNIGVIQVATQNALFASALIGAASLLACALVTLLILRWVAQPIERLKADALRIAAGDRAPPTAVKAPREAVKLRDALGMLADHLVASMRAARSATLVHDRTRNREMLEAALRGQAESPMVTLVDTPAALAVWAEGESSGAEALLQRRAMGLLAERIAGAPALAADLAALADPACGALLAVDREAKAVRLVGEQPATLRVGAEETVVAPGETLKLKARTALAVRTGGAFQPIAWEVGA